MCRKMKNSNMKSFSDLKYITGRIAVKNILQDGRFIG